MTRLLSWSPGSSAPALRPRLVQPEIMWESAQTGAVLQQFENLAGYYSLLYFWCFEWLTVSCCYNTEQAEEILHSELFYSENSEGLHADD